MKKKTRAILVISILLLTFAAGCLSVSHSSAEINMAAFQARTAVLKERFIDGEYWLCDFDTSNTSIDFDGTPMQTTPVDPHCSKTSAYGNCKHDCNEGCRRSGGYYVFKPSTNKWVRDGGQCYAFARLMGMEYFGTDPEDSNYWEKITNGQAKIQIGDIVRYSGHSVFILNVLENKKYSVVDCNWSGGPCKVDWDGERKISSFEYILRNKAAILINYEEYYTDPPVDDGSQTNTGTAVSRISENAVNKTSEIKTTTAVTDRCDFIITSPGSSQYTSKSDISIEGYLLTGRKIAYVMAECPEVPGCQWNLTSYTAASAKPAEKVLRAAGLSSQNYQYSYRFRMTGAFGPYTLKSNTTYHIRFWAGTSQGAYGNVQQITFRTGKLSSQTTQPVNPPETHTGGNTGGSTSARPTAPVAHLDYPTGSYTGGNNIEITGWVASQSAPGYVIVQYGDKQQNLTSTLSYDQYVDHAYGGGYTHNYRFRGVIPLSDLSSNTTYSCKVSIGFVDGTAAEDSRTFRVGTITRQALASAALQLNPAAGASPQPAAAGCRIVFDKPTGSYGAGISSVPVSGWLACNAAPGYLMAEFSNGSSGDQLNLTASLTASDGSGSGINASSYRYLYRFSGSIPAGKLEDGSSYTLKAWTALADGTSKQAETGFQTGTITGKKRTLLDLTLPTANSKLAGAIYISGWVASDSPIAYAQYQITDSSGSFMAGVSSISYHEDNLVLRDHPGYKYGYRFDTDLPLKDYNPQKNYSLRLWVGTDQNVRSDITRTFRVQSITDVNTQDYYLHLDLPAVNRSYSGSNNIEVTGWIGSYTPITYAMYQIDRVSGRFNGTQKVMGLYDEQDAAVWLHANGWNYPYVKRFRSVIEIGMLPSNTTFTFRVWCGLGWNGAMTDAWRDDAVHVFKTGNVVLPTYNITFDLNGAESGPSAITKTYNRSIQIPQVVPKRLGYNFEGWTTVRNSAKAEYYPGDTYTANEPLKLYAIWEKAAMISFSNPDRCNDAVGSGTGGHLSRDCRLGRLLFTFVPRVTGIYHIYLEQNEWIESLVLDPSGNPLVPAVQTFWYVNGLVDSIDDGYELEANQTYYISLGDNDFFDGGEWEEAHWQKTFDFSVRRADLIQYDANGGSNAPGDLYCFDYGVVSAEIPERSLTVTFDHADETGETSSVVYPLTFLGWTKAVDTDKESAAFLQSGEDIWVDQDSHSTTVYAVWEYPMLGETDPPVREGYTFTGWYTDCGEEIVSTDLVYTDLVIYATWARNEVLPESIQLSEASVEMKVDETALLSAEVLPENASSRTLLWWSEDPAVAVVDEKGVITPVSPGETVVHAAATASDAEQTCAVTVTDTNVEYPVTYDSFYNVTVPEPQVKRIHEDLALSDLVPVCEGKQFTGWEAQAADGTTVIYQPGDIYSGNAPLSLRAGWAELYTVEYDAGGGDLIPDSLTVRDGDTIALSDSIPARTGYTFLGWYDSSRELLLNPGAAVTVTGNIRLTARWEALTYTVSYNGANGSNVPENQTKITDADLNLSSLIPERDGFIFLGWAESPDAAVPAYQPGGVYKENRELTLYALWEAEPVAATGIHLNYMSYTALVNTSFNLQAIVEPSGTVSNNGVIWSSSDETVAAAVPTGSAGNSMAAITALEPGTAVITAASVDGGFTAQCEVTVEEKTYTFDFRGCAEAITARNRTYITMPEYTRSDGNELEFWYLPGSGSGYSATKRPGEQVLATMDRTWYAKTNPITYTVEFDANGGVGSFSLAKAYGRNLDLRSAELLTAVNRDGCRLIGWGSSADAAETMDYYSDNASAVLYAVWEKDGYAITFDANGGTGAPAPQIKPYSGSVQLTAQKPVRPRYTFLGWSTDPEAAAPQYGPGAMFDSGSETTLYAVWTETAVQAVWCDVRTITLPMNATYYLKQSGTEEHVGVEPEDAFNPKLYYSVQNPDVAEVTVLSNGSTVFVRSLQPGSTLLQIESEDGHCMVYIPVNVLPAEYTIVFDDNGGIGGPGERYYTRTNYSYYGSIAVTFPKTVPVREGYRFIGWSSSPDEMAGTYTTPGTRYEITSRYLVLYAIWETYTPVTGIETATPVLSMMLGGEASVTAQVLPSGASEQGYAWHSANENVAAVTEDGLITAVGEGTAQIIAVSVEGQYQATCTVTVASQYTVHFDANGGGNGPGDQTGTAARPVMVPQQKPVYAGHLFSGWALSAEAVLPDYVSGEAVVSAEDIILYAVWTERTAAAEELVIDLEELTIETGLSYLLGASILPSEADDGMISWASSDPSVIQIAEDGYITALAEGVSVISASTAGGSIQDTCLIHVIGGEPSYSAALYLPQNLKAVPVECFSGDSAVSAVCVPDGTELIEARAFAECSSLQSVRLPDSIIYMDDTALQGSPGARIVCHIGSCAERWAKKHNVAMVLIR